jgi:hypothetical protein
MQLRVVLTNGKVAEGLPAVAYRPFHSLENPAANTITLTISPLKRLGVTQESLQFWLWDYYSMIEVCAEQCSGQDRDF